MGSGVEVGRGDRQGLSACGLVCLYSRGMKNKNRLIYRVYSSGRMLLCLYFIKSFLCCAGGVLVVLNGTDVDISLVLK